MLAGDVESPDPVMMAHAVAQVAEVPDQGAHMDLVSARGVRETPASSGHTFICLAETI